MMKIGLTGGIGSGKSTIAGYFQEFGIPIYYADVEAKKLMHNSSALKAKIIALLGTESYVKNKLNRKYIANIVFENPEKLAQLNAIVHPAVAADFITWSKKQDAPYVIQENAIIFESNSSKRFDYVILVTAPRKLRIKRVMERDQVSENEVKKRIKNQWPESRKLEAADFLIRNIELSVAKRKAVKIHKQLTALKK